METGNWKLETEKRIGNWKIEIRNWHLGSPVCQ
jgi:hypothetical protein